MYNMFLNSEMSATVTGLSNNILQLQYQRKCLKHNRRPMCARYRKRKKQRNAHIKNLQYNTARLLSVIDDYVQEQISLCGQAPDISQFTSNELGDILSSCFGSRWWRQVCDIVESCSNDDAVDEWYSVNYRRLLLWYYNRGWKECDCMQFLQISFLVIGHGRKFIDEEMRMLEEIMDDLPSETIYRMLDYLQLSRITTALHESVLKKSLAAEAL